MTCDKCKDTPGWVEILDPRNVDEDGNVRPEPLPCPTGCKGEA